jgi:hypothetical protein
VAGSLLLLANSGKYTQKTSAVMNNLKKVEDIVYELSMLQKGGRGRVREDEKATEVTEE